MRALVASFVLLGCSIPDKHFTGDATSDSPRAIDGGDPDAQTPFGCFRKPLPTTAPALLKLTVHTIDAFNNMPVGNVNVSGYLVGSSTPLVSVTTDATTGQIAASVPTNGQPINGYLVATPPSTTGYMTSVLYPSRPFDQDASIQVNLLTPTGMSQAAQLAGVTVDTTKAQVSIGVVDCTGVPLANAIVATVDGGQAQTGVIRYLAGGVPSSSATATDAAGLAFSFNVKPGTVSVTAVVNGMTLRNHTFSVPSSEWTQTAIQP